jgi:hypothetical protein
MVWKNESVPVFARSNPRKSLQRSGRFYRWAYKESLISWLGLAPALPEAVILCLWITLRAELDVLALLNKQQERTKT